MKRDKKSRATKKSRRRLMMETLESRQLLAVDGFRINLGGDGGTNLLGPTGGGSIHEGYLSGGIGLTLHTDNVPGQNNALPIAGPDSHIMGQNDPAVDFLLSTLISNDRDPDSDDPLAFLGIDASDTIGKVSFDEANNKLTYDPNGQLDFVADGQIGTDTFRYSVADAEGGIGIGTVTITFNGVNDRPSFSPGADVTVDEDAGPQTVVSWATNVTDGDSETDGLVFEITSNTNVDLFLVAPAIDAAGNLTFTAADHASGEAELSVRINDGQASDNLSTLETFKITVNSVNDPPTFELIAKIDADVHDGTHTEAAVVSFAMPGPDQESDQAILALQISGNTDPGMFSTQPSLDRAGNLTFTPTATGTATLTITATDDGGTDHGGTNTTSKQLVVNISERNRSPELVAWNGSPVVNEGESLSYAAQATDLNDDRLTFSLTNAPAGMSIRETGEITWTPTEADGPASYFFDVIVSDGEFHDSATALITVMEVNTAPILDLISDFSIDEGTLLSFSANATDADEPNNTLSFSLGGAPPGNAEITSSGDFTWTPAEEHGPGQHSIRVNVFDGTETTFQEFTVSVAESNSIPELDPISAQTVEEGSELTFNVTGTDIDEPAQTLTFSLDSNAPAGADITSAGEFRWTPDETQGPADHTFGVVVNDGIDSRIETITVAVGEVNTAPQIDPIADRAIDEGQTLTFTANAIDVDLPANTLTFGLDPSYDQPAGAEITPHGIFNWTPSEAQGSETFTIGVIVSDGARFDTTTFTVTVTELNAAPQLDSIDNQTIGEGQQLVFTASATDADLPANHLLYSLSEAAPEGAIMTPEGEFTWTPSETHGAGTFTFDVIVNDGKLTDSQPVTITVDETNQVPMFEPIANQMVDENSTLAFWIAATDADWPAQNLVYSLADGAPENASISPVGEFNWTPSELHGGKDYTFDVEVSDGQLTNSTTLVITVNEVNEAPILDPIGEIMVAEDQSLAFTATATDIDLPQDLKTFRLTGEVPSGAQMTSEGVFTWTPTDDQFPGTYTFGVEVSDGVRMDSETITIALEKSIQNKYPIDGNVDFSGLHTRTESIDFDVSGTSSSVTIGFDHDDRNLYVALEWNDSTLNNKWYDPQTSDDEIVRDYDEVVLQIDGNGDSVIDSNEDYRWVRATNSGSFFRDAFFDGVREQDDVVGDGLAKLRYDPASEKYQAEFLIPLSNDIHNQDSTITASSRFQLIVRDGYRPNEGILNQAIVFAASDLPEVPLHQFATLYDHPILPTDLTGLIVYISRHEDPAGEIYTFDPATGETFRVTNNTLAENSVSLSRDRTKIAFDAFIDSSDPTTLEVFSINVDGTQLLQLTDDGNANAHPAWSPDGTKLSYSPIFPESPGITIISDSGQFLQNLTPQGIVDHDADYLPDGRIIFKTNRWSDSPQYLTGVMNEDGTNVQQLTFANNVSDHDQFGNDEAVIFERFNKGTDYETDPETPTLGWDLIEVPLDGSGEVTLLSDGWMNTTPVYDPTGKYILYMRGPAYFEASLMTRDGTVLGRLIPDVTQIEFIEWR